MDNHGDWVRQQTLTSTLDEEQLQAKVASQYRNYIRQITRSAPLILKGTYCVKAGLIVWGQAANIHRVCLLSVFDDTEGFMRPCMVLHVSPPTCLLLQVQSQIITE